MKTPKISIIVPVYNAEKYLQRCIESILAQTFRDFELLLIDDGSKDNSGYICDEYAGKDERVKVWHKENGGVSAARNVGLDNAKSEWVTFSDSDDWVEEDWLVTFSENMKGYDAVVTGFNFVTSETIKPFVMDCHSDNPARVADYLNKERNYGFLWCKCFKRSLIECQKLRFNEKLSFLEDEDFVCRYWSISESINVVPHITYNYWFPDYDDKYGKIDCFDVYLSLLTTSTQFINYKHSASLDRYALCCHRCLLHSYQQHKYQEAFDRLKKIAGIKCKSNLLPRVRFIAAYNYMIWHLLLIVYTLEK